MNSSKFGLPISSSSSQIKLMFRGSPFCIAYRAPKRAVRAGLCHRWNHDRDNDRYPLQKQMAHGSTPVPAPVEHPCGCRWSVSVLRCWRGAGNQDRVSACFMDLHLGAETAQIIRRQQRAAANVRMSFPDPCSPLEPRRSGPTCLQTPPAAFRVLCGRTQVCR